MARTKKCRRPFRLPPIATHKKGKTLLSQHSYPSGEPNCNISNVNSKAANMLSKLNQKIDKMNTFPFCPVPKSVHRMALRSRGNYSRLNKNHSARHSRKLQPKFSCIWKSRESSAMTCKRQKIFKAPLLGQLIQSSQASFSNDLVPEHRGRYKHGHNRNQMRNYLGPRRDITRDGPSGFSNVDFQGRCHFSDRHLRHLRRCQQKDVFHKRLSPVSDLCLLKSKKRLRVTQSLLSCGSVQMLYKGKDRYYRHTGMKSKAPLPINFRDYRQCRISRRKEQVHERTLSRKFHYNLRSRSISTPNHGVVKAKRMLEVLPKAAPVKPRELTEEELKLLVEKEELTLMELRIFLRDVLNKLGSDRKFSIFAKPVNIEDAPDYLDIIETPMDMSTMMSKIDLHEYTTVRSFMDDLDLICTNALEYNPNRGPMDRVIRHRACALKDTAYAIIKTELDKDFEKMCVEIEESRKRRGVKSSTVPNYYYTKPVSKPSQETSTKSSLAIPSYLQENRPPRSIPKPGGERFSRRVRGLNIGPVVPLEDVERIGRMSRSNNSPTDNKNNSNTKLEEIENSSQDKLNSLRNEGDSQSAKSQKSLPTSSKSCESDSVKTNSASNKSLSKRSRCIWCKPKRKRRRLIFTKTSASKTSEEADENASQEDDEDTEDNAGAETSFNQALSVDVSDYQTETDDLKSPSRKSTRLHSPQSTAMGVTTRRQSLSPRLSSGLSQGKIPDKETSTEQNSHSHIDIHTETQSQQESSLSSKQSNFIDMSVSDTQLIALNKKLRGIANNPDKLSVVKRLDLDSTAVDSGAGSSLESNGDSRDSSDHKLEGNSTSGNLTSSVDMSNNCSLDLVKHANNVLSEQSQKLEVPADRLTSLLSRLVHVTDSYNVENLEKIYSRLSQVIYRHRHSYNRTSMVLELEAKVEELIVFQCGSSSKNH